MSQFFVDDRNAISVVWGNGSPLKPCAWSLVDRPQVASPNPFLRDPAPWSIVDFQTSIFPFELEREIVVFDCEGTLQEVSRARHLLSTKTIREWVDRL